MNIPSTIDQILDELYRQHQNRINRATDREIDAACRSAVERMSEREKVARPGRAAA